MLKTYGSVGLRGIDRALHTTQARKLHKLSHKLRGMEMSHTMTMTMGENHYFLSKFEQIVLQNFYFWTDNKALIECQFKSVQQS